jgi:hypothetical protein
LKSRRCNSLAATLTALISCQWAVSCTREYSARLESYRALVTRGPADAANLKNESAGLSTQPELPSARLSAASFILSREDLIPCSSLPPRKLTSTNGEVFWLDGNWSNFARPFIVKGSAQSGLCRIELHPYGPSNLPLGGKDTFVRQEQIRFLISTASGDSIFPPSNRGFVKCYEKQNQFEVSYEGLVLGQTSISYVMNESIHLELHPRVCLARLLDAAKKPTPEWVFILPTWETSLPSPSAETSSETGSLR